MSDTLNGHGHSAFDAQNELAVIGCVLDDPDYALPLVREKLSASLFFNPLAKAVLWAIGEDLTEDIRPDTLTVSARLRAANKLEEVGGDYAVRQLVDPLNRASVTNLRWEIETLRDKAAQRFAMGTRVLGETTAEIVQDLESKIAAVREIQGVDSIEAAPLGSLTVPAPDDGKTLLGNRYLERGASALLVGPTGIGKSSLAMQAMVCWSRAKPCFGIAPSGYLKSLLIQAENDDGDLAEMRDGVFDGLELSARDREMAGELILCHQDDTHSGSDFFRLTVEPLLREHAPDLLWIDPALAYIDGNSDSKEDVGRFLRRQLNPLLHKYECAGIVIHHTNKPPSGKEKTDWTGSDLAYLGSGSAEWANCARAVIGVRSLGSNDVFELCLGKRGNRVGWRDENGAPIYSTLIAHAKEPGRIYWRNADESERPDGEKKTGRPKVFTPEKLLEILGDGSKLISEWWTAAEAQMWSRATFKRCVAELKHDNRLHESKLDGRYSRKKI